MKDSFSNSVLVRGRVFDFDLTKRTTGATSKTPNMNYIMGRVNVAVDEDGMNVVPVSFGFLSTRETYRNGKENATYQTLLDLIEKEEYRGRTWKDGGKDAALQVRIDGDIETNDFVTSSGEMASPKQVRGAFIHLLTPAEEGKNFGATFEADMLAQGAAMRESTDGSEYMELKGFVFGYSARLFPITLSVPGENGQQFFDNEDITPSNPYFGKVWGNIRSTVQVIEREVDDSNVGFGVAPAAAATTRTLRTWDVDGANVNLGLSEDTITQEELQNSYNVREEHLADIRRQWEERNNSGPARSGFPASSAAPKSTKKATSAADFKF